MSRRLYFAYGSNMDEGQMASRCPDSKLVGKCSVSGHRFLINERGVASIRESQHHAVHGLAWDISEADERNLDRFEGVAKGFYRKVSIPVMLANGSTADALVYVAASNSPGTPRPGYMEKILQAAKNHGIDAEPIKELESWLAPNTTKSAKNG